MKHDIIKYTLNTIILIICIAALSIACVTETQSIHKMNNANGFNGTITNKNLELKVSGSHNGVLNNEDEKLILASNENITSKLLTGFIESSGIVTSNNTILEAIEKLSGIPEVTVVQENGFRSATGPNLSLRISPANGLLSAQSNSIVLANSTDVTSKLLTGYVANTGTITANDTILEAFGKLVPIPKSIAKVQQSTSASGGSTIVPNSNPMFTTISNLTLVSFSNDFSLVGQTLTYTGTYDKTFRMTVQITVNNPSVSNAYYLWIQKGSVPALQNNNLVFEWKSDVAEFLTQTFTDIFDLVTNDTLQPAVACAGSFPITLTHPVVSYYIYEI